MDETLRQLIEMVKALSPQAWAIAQRQVQVWIIKDSALMAIHMLLMYLCLRFGLMWLNSAKKSHTVEIYDTVKHEYTGVFKWDGEFGGIAWPCIVMALGTLVTGISIISRFIEWLGLILNPDYYAIFGLIELAKGVIH
jgi:hypothetical protein